MPARVIVWGFDGDISFAIRQLEETHIIRVMEWIQDDGDKHPNALSIYLFFSSRLLTECPARWRTYYDSAQPIALIDELRQFRSEFVEHYLRHDVYKNRVTSCHDCEHLFEVMARMVVGLLITTQAQWVFFSNIPHEG